MIKTRYRIIKKYSPIASRIVYEVQKYKWILLCWIWVDTKQSEESAAKLIKLLEDEL